MDADDIVLPRRFLDAIECLQQTGAQLCGGDLLPFHSDNGDAADPVSFPTHAQEIAGCLPFYCPIWGCAETFRRSVLQQVPYPHSAYAEDWLFAHRVVRAYGEQGLANTGTPLVRYRLHATQATRQAGGFNEAIWPIWREVLTDSLDLRPSLQELRLHARFSPYLYANPLRKTTGAHDLHQWQQWSERVLHAARRLAYAPIWIERHLRQVEQNIRICQQAHLPTQHLLRIP